MQLPENITLFAICCTVSKEGKVDPWSLSGVLCIYRLYEVGARTEPYDTPAHISQGTDSLLPTITLNFLLERNEQTSLIEMDKK
jgi:hypothetical protein